MYVKNTFFLFIVAIHSVEFPLMVMFHHTLCEYDRSIAVAESKFENTQIDIVS